MNRVVEMWINQTGMEGKASTPRENEEMPSSRMRLQFGQNESAYNRVPGVNDNVDLLPRDQASLPGH